MSLLADSIILYRQTLSYPSSETVSHDPSPPSAAAPNRWGVGPLAACVTLPVSESISALTTAPFSRIPQNLAPVPRPSFFLSTSGCNVEHFQLNTLPHLVSSRPSLFRQAPADLQDLHCLLTVGWLTLCQCDWPSGFQSRSLFLGLSEGISR